LANPYKSILRWMGGKSKLAPFIIYQYPKHTCYVEAFCGGAAILLRKPDLKLKPSMILMVNLLIYIVVLNITQMSWLNKLWVCCTVVGCLND